MQSNLPSGGRSRAALSGAFLIALTVGEAAGAGSAAAEAGGYFTPAQAARGAVVFADNCAICHGATLAGGPAGPALLRPFFCTEWGGRSVAELYGSVRGAMPMGRPNSLDPAAYGDVLAFILARNGLAPGTAELIPEGARILPPAAAWCAR